MSRSSSSFTNPLSLILIFLALIWVFSLAKSCGNSSSSGNDPTTVGPPPSPVPNFQKLVQLNCPLKLSESDEMLANALLQQYFRLDTLSRFQEAVWRPDAKLDPVFAKQFEGDWETYIECIQTLEENADGQSEKLAIIATNFQDNDCQTCAPQIGYIRFSTHQDDPSTIVIRGSERALFTFGAYGAIGDKISLVNLGAQKALAFTTAHTDRGHTHAKTAIYSIDDFQLLLEVNSYESNGGTDEDQLFERKGELYYQANERPGGHVKLALHENTVLLSRDNTKPPVSSITYYQYQPNSMRYIETD